MATIKQLSNTSILQIRFLCFNCRHQQIILGFVVLVVDAQASSSRSLAWQSKLNCAAGQTWLTDQSLTPATGTEVPVFVCVGESCDRPL